MAFFCQNDIKKNLETWCSEGALTFSWVRKSGPTSFIQNILIHLWWNNILLRTKLKEHQLKRSLEEKDGDMLEAPFTILCNDFFQYTTPNNKTSTNIPKGN
jgi:hypothetical protein